MKHPQIIAYLYHQVHYRENLWLIVDYLDDRPSISLTGVIANADGDVSTPPSGRGVVVRDLHDFDARRRFGAFGRTFVELERLRRSRSKEEANRTSTEKFVRMYNVTLHAIDQADEIQVYLS
jgi:hypothetical protein